MISVDEALQLVLQNTASLKSVNQKISEALGSVLAEAIKSPIDSPPFAQSSMDGYAIRFADVDRKVFKIQGENMAGRDSGLILEKRRSYPHFYGRYGA
jgi:molybdopterin molybdotransferase